MGQLEKYRQRVYRCTRCGTCRAKYNNAEKIFRVCPAGEHTSGFWINFPSGRVQMGLEVMEGRLTYTPAAVKAIYDCLLCGNCRETCGALDMATFTPMIDHPAITKAMRADIFASGIPVPEAVTQYGNAIEKTHNVLMAAPEERASWLTPDIKVTKNANTVYFPGCLAAYRAPEVARATAKILNALGIKFDVIGEDEFCCGNPLIMTGQLDLAREVARHNAEQLKGKRIITACAGCFRTFTDEYPGLLGEESDKINCVHIVQVLAEQIQAGKLKFKAHKGKKEKVTYHDPCELGRIMKVYDEPRIIINAIPGVELVEMARNKERTWCCGGGGGVKGTNPDLSLEVGKDKVKETLATGAKRIISACPSCKININDAIRKMGKEAEIKTIDITELVVEAL